MKKINEIIEQKHNKYPEKILQFGEGNFLRAFTDWMINKANQENVYQGSIVLCQPIAQGLSNLINEQDGVYTLAMRGIENGEAVEKIEQITSVSRCINPYEDYNALLKIARSSDLEVIISNTTEAGIVYNEGDKLTDQPPSSFPAKITALLYERYKTFNGDNDKGLLFLPVELIDNNGAELKRIVLQYANDWKLDEEFINWIETANKFASTLVDRIVTGYPKDELNYFEDKLEYKDNIIVTSELFNLWVIEGKKEWSDILPIHKTDANVIWTEDVTPYKKRKVRILNGAHTSTVLAAYLSGHDIVLDFMNDDIFKNYLNNVMFKEIIPTLDLPKEELESFAFDVIDRFANPYIKHRLLDISLNSASKFNARCLPSLLEYIESKNEIPVHLTFSLAAFIKFYQGKIIDGNYVGTRFDGTTYTIKDNTEIIEFFANTWSKENVLEVAHDVLSNKSLWSGKDLTLIDSLEESVAKYLADMETCNIKDLVANLDCKTVLA